MVPTSMAKLFQLIATNYFLNVKIRKGVKRYKEKGLKEGTGIPMADTNNTANAVLFLVGYLTEGVSQLN